MSARSRLLDRFFPTAQTVPRTVQFRYTPQEKIQAVEALNEQQLLAHEQFIQEIEQRRVFSSCDQVDYPWFANCDGCHKLFWIGVALTRGVIETFPEYEKYTKRGPDHEIGTLCPDCKGACYCPDSHVRLPDASASCKVCHTLYCVWHKQNVCDMCDDCLWTWNWGKQLRQSLLERGVPPDWTTFRDHLIQSLQSAESNEEPVVCPPSSTWHWASS